MNSQLENHFIAYKNQYPMIWEGITNTLSDRKRIESYVEFNHTPGQQSLTAKDFVILEMISNWYTAGKPHIERSTQSLDNYNNFCDSDASILSQIRNKCIMLTSSKNNHDELICIKHESRESTFHIFILIPGKNHPQLITHQMSSSSCATIREQIEDQIYCQKEMLGFTRCEINEMTKKLDEKAERFLITLFHAFI